MAYHIGRWLFALLLVMDWTDIIDLAQYVERSGEQTSLLAQVVEEVDVFVPIALRFREEAVRRIALDFQTWQECLVLSLPLPSENLAAPRFFLPRLHPMYGLMSLQP